MSNDVDDLPPYLRPQGPPLPLPAQELPLEEIPESPPPAVPCEEQSPDPYLRRS